jgi:hypothetical protein
MRGFTAISPARPWLIAPAVVRTRAGVLKYPWHRTIHDLEDFYQAATAARRTKLIRGLETGAGNRKRSHVLRCVTTDDERQHSLGGIMRVIEDYLRPGGPHNA